MDSCRFDSYASARTPNMDRIGAGERRYSFASWTSPSHYTYLMGQTPHSSPRGVFASEVYKKEYAKWIARLGIPNMSFKTFVPQLSLPKVLKHFGYRTVGRVSMPVLNPMAGFNRNFDDYRLMDNHNDFAGMVRAIEFSGSDPYFYFLNLGETHYPYMLTDAELPRISGVHGVVSGLDELLMRTGDDPSQPGEFFSKAAMEELHAQQIKCVEYIDGLVGELLDKCPANTHFIVTSDHGELFGEDNYFGHGPVMHDKCFEVPYLEGIKPD
jgi:hypothetical protein